MKPKIKVILASLILSLLTGLSVNSSSAACGTLTALYDPATYTSGTTLTDQSGCLNNATIVSGTPSKTNLPAKFLLNQGSAGQYFYMNQSFNSPTTFSYAIWFRTSIAGGTKIIGFVQSTGNAETNYDRHLYIGTDGHLYYGIYDGSAVHTVSNNYSIADGKWHFAAVTENATPAKVYIDTQTALSLTNTAQNYTGYWKVGGYKLTAWSGPGALGDGDWVGDIGKVYIYSANQITDTDVANLYASGKSSYILPSAFVALSSGTSATYRTLSNLQLNSGVDGKVTFYQAGKKIPGCQSLTTNGGSVTCPWKPSIHNASNIYAKLIPIDTGFATITSAGIQVPIVKRSGQR